MQAVYVRCEDHRRDSCKGMKRYFKVIRKGDEEEVSRLLDADPTLVEREHPCGDRPLTIAAEARQLGMVKLLVQRKADINASGRRGVTALHRAAGGGLKEMVAFLLSKGAQARCTDEEGETPLKHAFDRVQAGVMKVLLPHMGLQGLEERIGMRWTPLMEACGEGKVGLVREIVQHMGGQELEETDNRGRTAVHWAALEGHDEVVAILLNKGAQAGIRDAEHSTPLMKAASRGHLGVVQLIVQHTGGQGLDATSFRGETALHCAVLWGHEAVVTFLLSQGAQAINANRSGMTPLMLATLGGHVGMAQLLLELQGGQGLDRRDIMGKTALHWSVRGGHAEVAALLLRNGAGPSIRDWNGRTPLMEVCELGQLGVLQILLQEVGEQGLRERDRHGYTALHWAACCDHEEAVQSLLLAGADPTIKDGAGRTPLTLAEKAEHGECTDVFEVSMPQSRFNAPQYAAVSSLVIIPSALHGMSRSCTSKTYSHVTMHGATSTYMHVT
jgi:ankyrin repeat protein